MERTLHLKNEDGKMEVVFNFYVKNETLEFISTFFDEKELDGYFKGRIVEYAFSEECSEEHAKVILNDLDGLVHAAKQFFVFTK